MQSKDFRLKVASVLGKVDLSYSDLQDDFILNSIIANEDSMGSIDPIEMRTSFMAMQDKLNACIQVLEHEMQATS